MNRSIPMIAAFLLALLSVTPIVTEGRPRSATS
jgi:hypothetical protein